MFDSGKRVMADEEVQQNQSSEPAAAAAEPAAEVVPPAGGEAPSSDAMAEAEALAASLNAGIAAGGAAGAEAAAPDAPGSPDEGPSIESLLAGAGVDGGGGAQAVVDPLADLSDEVRRILKIQVPVIVKLADKMLPLGDIVDLTPGSIVEFSRNAEQPLELMVNNKTIGRGVAVKVGEKFGLRIEEILPVQQKIRSLGA
jgi:flagellar motor switch protein FliN/FliY